MLYFFHKSQNHFTNFLAKKFSHSKSLCPPRNRFISCLSPSHFLLKNQDIVVTNVLYYGNKFSTLLSSPGCCCCKARKTFPCIKLLFLDISISPTRTPSSNLLSILSTAIILRLKISTL